MTISMKHVSTFLFLFLLFFSFASVGLAQEEEDDDWEIVPGVEGEEVFNLGSAVLALVLLGLTFAAYKKSKKTRLLYVSLAFFLFAIKGFLVSSELFIDEISFVDPLASVLDFGILLSFFFGLLKK